MRPLRPFSDIPIQPHAQFRCIPTHEQRSSDAADVPASGLSAAATALIGAVGDLLLAAGGTSRQRCVREVRPSHPRPEIDAPSRGERRGGDRQRGQDAGSYTGADRTVQDGKDMYNGLLFRRDAQMAESSGGEVSWKSMYI